MLTLYSLSSNVLAFTPDLNGKFYNPIMGVKDLSFQIESTDLNDLFQQFDQKISSFKASLYLEKDNIATVLEDSDKYPEKIKDKLKKIAALKARVVIGFDLDKWLVNYKLIKSTKNKFFYRDETGLLNVSEIYIEKNKDNILIKEKHHDSTQKTEYFYQKNDWADGQLVLSKIIRTFDQSDEKFTTITHLDYKEFQGRWLPVNAKTTTTQKFENGSDDTTTRLVVENFTFSQYKIDKESAKNFFSSKN